MTLTLKPKVNKSLGNQIPDNIKNSQTIVALKRYLDLTLTGTKKNLAEHSIRGSKAHPPSPYTYDKPDLQSAIQQALNKESAARKSETPPKWVQNINSRICKHNGEAPIFSENLLPSNKSDQLKISDSRPMSGLSTKSAPVFFNGEMYYRPNSKHSYLQASNRPLSAKNERTTRASVLRNKHRIQAMTAIPCTDTQIRFREMKSAKPRTRQLNKDLMPIPCHTGESTHSFIVGARYNRCNHMDARSYDRLGLYVPRNNPLHTFLKVYRGEDALTEPGSDTDYVGFTSVRAGDPTGKETRYDPAFIQEKQAPNRSLPPPHLRKVVPEGWLSGQPPDSKPPPYKPPSGRSRTSSKRSSVAERKSSSGRERLQQRTPSRTSTVHSSKSQHRCKFPGSRTKTPDPSRINVKGQTLSNVDAESLKGSRKQAELEE